METRAWSSIAYERLALAEDLSHVHGRDWDTPSLCEGWTVHEALGHVVATATLTPARFAVGMALSFGKVAKLTDKRARAAARGKHQDTVNALRDVVLKTDAPPGPETSWLGEIIVHSCDIRIPLGIEHGFALEDVREVAKFYAGSNALLGSKKRIDGLTLRATDSSWTHGAGPEVSGPLILLVLAMTGRGELVLEQLDGPGVDVLRARRAEAGAGGKKSRKQKKAATKD